MRNYHIDNKTDIKLHNILFAVTSELYWEMDRLLLLTDMPDTEHDDYVLVEGGHCSCYDFDETSWDATVYTREELIKLLENERHDELRLKLKEFLKYYGII